MFNRQRIWKSFLCLISMTLLFFGTIGVLSYNDNPQLAYAILSLVLLSLGLFFRNHIPHFVQTYGNPTIARFFPWVLLIGSAFVMIFLECVYWIENGGKIFLVPLYMASLAIGLYLANIILTLNEHQ